MTPELLAAFLAALILGLYRYRRELAALIRTCRRAWTSDTDSDE